MEYGITINKGSGDTRLGIQCGHQKGLLYVVPAEANWVCNTDNIHAHALAGFLSDLTDLDDVRVRTLMQRWGIYFRNLPRDEDPTK